MKSSQLYFKQACDALKVVAEDPNATAVESSDIFSQVELTRGLMLFGQDQVRRISLYSVLYLSQLFCIRGFVQTRCVV